MRKTYNLIDGLVVTIQTICAVGLIGTLLGGCTPIDPSVEGSQGSPNTDTNVTYYQDPRTDVCFGALQNRLEGTFSVECTPKVLALIYGPTQQEPEIAR